MQGGFHPLADTVAKGSSKISIPPKCAKVISLTIFWCLWPAPVQDHKHFLVKQDFEKSMTVSFERNCT